MGGQAARAATRAAAAERIVSVVASPVTDPCGTPVIEVRLLGRFIVTGGGRSIASWPRPSARRLCQLVLVSPGRRVSRESACEALFSSLSPEPAARSLYKVQSLARQALKELGAEAAGLLCADPGQIWANPGVALAVDLDAHQEALQAALGTSPGPGRDAALVEALSTGGVPLEDEPEAEWAAPVRERVQYLRQEARLELARDRMRGVGCAHPEEVLQAWQDCLEADPADEEAASALMRLYGAQGRRPLALAVYESCRAALAKLGLGTAPALEELRANTEGAAPLQGHASPLGADAVARRRLQERRLVSVLSVELSPSGGLSAPADPEDLVERVGAGLAEAISEAELLGGTVASVSGSGMSVLFGAPQAHEDDPERALRSALRISAAVGRTPGSRPTRLAMPTQPSSVYQRWSCRPASGWRPARPWWGRSAAGAGWTTGRWATSSAPLAPWHRWLRPPRCSSAPPPGPPPKGSSSGDRTRTWSSPRARSRSKLPTWWGRGRARSPRQGGAARRPRPRW